MNAPRFHNALRNMLSSIEGTVERHAAWRRAMARGWSWTIEHWPWLLATPRRAQFAYRFHYRLLHDWYEAASPSDSELDADWVAAAAGADNALRSQLRTVLLGVEDPIIARELNTALAQLERARGLGRTITLPEQWAVELGAEPTAVMWAIPVWRYAANLRFVSSVKASLHRAWPLLEKVRLTTSAEIALRIPLELLEPDFVGRMNAYGIETLECEVSLENLAQLRTAAGTSWCESLTQFAGDQRQLILDVTLSRRTLTLLENLLHFGAVRCPLTVRLHYLRVIHAADVADSLFFEADMGREAVCEFRRRATKAGMAVMLPDAPTEVEPYSIAHLSFDGTVSSCGNRVHSSGPIRSVSEFLDWWDAPVWSQFRRNICLGHAVPECRICGVAGTEDRASVEYHLASYSAGEPEQEYLDAVRAALDGVAEVAVARDRNARIRHFEHTHGHTRLASYPHRMYIEVTDECNLRCPMCTQTVLTGPRRRVSLDLVRKVTPLMRYMDLIHFTGCGEAFLHPQLFDMLKLVPHEHCAVRIITNGLLLDERASRLLIELQMKDLWVSLDGTDAATFERIRGSKLFHKVVENVRTLTRLKRELGSTRPEVALNFVAQRSNIAQLPDFIRMAKELGADAVNVGFLQVYSRDLLTESLYFYQDLADHWLGVARAVADEIGIRLYLPGLFVEARERIVAGENASATAIDDSVARHKCVEPYGFVLLRADGQLGPCCVNDARLGSLVEHDFATLWNGPAYRDFRQRVSTPLQDFDCEHCMLEGYKDITEFEHHVKLFDDHYRREDIDYAELEAEVRAMLTEVAT